MWKDIERHFLNAHTLVWINPRSIRHLVGLIPDVVITRDNDPLAFIAVEVKRTITRKNFSTALGQCIRFRRFSTRIYLAAHEEIPRWAIEELSTVASEIGILSINDVGGVKILREPRPIKQNNEEYLRRIYSTLYLDTTRWGPSVGGRRKRLKLLCLLCGKRFDSTLDECPNCGAKAP
jgi:hypothetical protein